VRPLGAVVANNRRQVSGTEGLLGHVCSLTLWRLVVGQNGKPEVFSVRIGISGLWCDRANGAGHSLLYGGPGGLSSLTYGSLALPQPPPGQTATQGGAWGSRLSGAVLPSPAGKYDGLAPISLATLEAMRGDVLVTLFLHECESCTWGEERGKEKKNQRK
jgi:hypothetical protein